MSPAADGPSRYDLEIAARVNRAMAELREAVQGAADNGLKVKIEVWHQEVVEDDGVGVPRERYFRAERAVGVDAVVTREVHLTDDGPLVAGSRG